jgi:hypothetical protein
VRDLPYTLDQFYKDQSGGSDPMPIGLAGAIRAIFEDLDEPADGQAVKRHLASTLLKRMEPELMANIFRWTGHFPERTRVLIRHLAQIADDLKQVYPEDQERQAMIAVTTLVTSLAMNHVHTGTYLA